MSCAKKTCWQLASKTLPLYIIYVALVHDERMGVGHSGQWWKIRRHRTENCQAALCGHQITGTGAWVWVWCIPLVCSRGYRKKGEMRILSGTARRKQCVLHTEIMSRVGINWSKSIHKSIALDSAFLFVLSGNNKTNPEEPWECSAPCV